MGGLGRGFAVRRPNVLLHGFVVHSCDEFRGRVGGGDGGAAGGGGGTRAVLILSQIVGSQRQAIGMMHGVRSVRAMGRDSIINGGGGSGAGDDGNGDGGIGTCVGREAI